MPLKNRLARVNALHVEPERCIYLSLQINNTVDSQPDLGCVNMVSGCGRAGVRISTMLGEIFGPGVGSRSQILDVLDRDVAIREDIRQVLQAKYPVILITMFLPGGARVAIRKHVRRKIAAGLYRFIRATEKQIPL